MQEEIKNLQFDIVSRREMYRERILKREEQSHNIEIDILKKTNYVIEDDRFKDIYVPEIEIGDELVTTGNKMSTILQLKDLREKIKALNQISKQICKIRKCPLIKDSNQINEFL